MAGAWMSTTVQSFVTRRCVCVVVACHRVHCRGLCLTCRSLATVCVTHQHVFSMNGLGTWELDLANGGTADGCRDLVGQGVIPNQVPMVNCVYVCVCVCVVNIVCSTSVCLPRQVGTWIYGRAGWCPGVSCWLCLSHHHSQRSTSHSPLPSHSGTSRCGQPM